jgi:hypothetical protein
VVNATIDTIAPITNSYEPAPHLGPDQRKALAHVLSSPDRFTGFRGVAGTGKSTVLGELTCVLRDEGLTPVFYAPTASAADTLRKDNLPAMTLGKLNFVAAGITPAIGWHLGDGLLVEDERSRGTVHRVVTQALFVIWLPLCPRGHAYQHSSGHQPHTVVSRGWLVALRIVLNLRETMRRNAKTGPPRWRWACSPTTLLTESTTRTCDGDADRAIPAARLRRATRWRAPEQPEETLRCCT